MFDPSALDTAYIRIIGDVHGRILPYQRKIDRDRDRMYTPAIWRDPRVRGRSYRDLVSAARYSVQVGDLSMDYTQLQSIDSRFHRVIAGNHDDLGRLTSHFLGDFGVHTIPLLQGQFEFFFVRGAASIDLDYRVEGLNWWPDEQLDTPKRELALQLYTNNLPKIVISHDCPSELVPQIATLRESIPLSSTNQMLQDMFETHAPSWWFFGHHHRNWVFQHPRGTRFVCLGSLSYFDFDQTGKSISPAPV